MGYKKNYCTGEVPESGAIFMSNIGTKKECLRRNLCGLPPGMTDFVLQVKKGMTLFLFEYERRLLYGVYRATSDGDVNIEPRAFRSSGKCFPAQVRFTSVWDCSPLAEHEFQDVIRDNYVSGKKFNFGLNKDQVSKLMKLFHSKRLSKSPTERNALRHGDKSAGEDSRFRHLRKDMRDRLRFVSEKDGHDPYICDSVSEEVKEVDDHFYSTKNSVEVRQKDSRDGFETNYDSHDNDFTDCVTRQDVLGKHHDHSFGPLRRVADAGLNFTGDANDGHEMQGNFEEKKVITIGDSFFMENRKRQHDIDGGYIPPPFTKPHEKCYGEVSIASNDPKVLIDGKRNDDYARIDDEYNNVREGFGQTLSEGHLGSPSGMISQTTNDRNEYSNEAVDNELRKLNEQSLSKPVYREGSIFRPITLTEHHPVCTPKETTFGIKPDDNKYNGFESFSHLGQSTYSLSCDPTIKEVSDSRVSYFAGGSSFIPLDDAPMYLTTSNEIPTLLPVSPYSPSHPHIEEGSMRYFENPDYYASLSRSQLTVEGKQPLCDTALLEGSNISLYPDFISKRISSSDAGLCVRAEDPIDNDRRLCRPRSSDSGSRVREEDPIHNDRRLCRPRSSDAAGSRMRQEDPVNIHKRSHQSHESKHKHSFGNNRRISVFARLNSGIRHEKQESENDKKHELDASVDKVMEMLEKAVSSPINKIGKRKLASKEDDGDNTIHLNNVDHELPELKMEVDADLADEEEETEDESPLPETRIVDFKRRKKANKCTDESSKEKLECLVGPTSEVKNNKLMGESCKRRKLVRPAGFIENKSSADGVCVAAINTDTLQSSSSNSDSISTKEVHENIKSVDINMMPPDSHNKPTPPEDDNKSTDAAALESSETIIVESIKPVEDVFMLPTPLKKIPSKEDSSLTETVVGESEKVSSEGEKCEQVEVSEKVDECPTSGHEGEESSKVKDVNAEIGSYKDGDNSTIKAKAVLTISEKATDECQKSVQEGEESCSQVKDGNAENRIVSDGFVEAIKVSSSKDDQKMCGWIEW
ncbi:uncharacterized protein [Rutidosis leptorrhynchoides]